MNGRISSKLLVALGLLTVCAPFVMLPSGASRTPSDESTRSEPLLPAVDSPRTHPGTTGRPSEVVRAVATEEVPSRRGDQVLLCQAFGPPMQRQSGVAYSSGITYQPGVAYHHPGMASQPNEGVVYSSYGWDSHGGWESARASDWQAYLQGEYVARPRTAHVREYRLRVDDVLELIYRFTREETPTPYRLNVGDEVSVESYTDEDLNRDLTILPDGTITLRLLGQIHATGRTVDQLREELENRYREFYKLPAITVTPLKVNSKLEDLRSAVDSRYGRGGQGLSAKVSPEGTISLPVVGSVRAQGLTRSELQQELNEAYRMEIEGIEVIPTLFERAPRYAYVLGEVKAPGRFELVGPTTVMQMIAMAGSWNVGANLKQVVVFRRGDDWRLKATMLDLEGALGGEDPCPAGEIWVADCDVVILPKSTILRVDDFIELVFTRGIYGVFPLSSSISFAKLSSL